MKTRSYSSDIIFLHKQWENKLYKFESEKGSIIMMPHPPGSTQLEYYIPFLQKEGVDILVSMLANEETQSLNLISEASLCELHDIEFINFSLQDHSVPQFFVPFNQLIEKLSNEFRQGKNIAIHCYAGIGRTGLTAASILIKNGFHVDMALLELSRIRKRKVPETLEQITWLHRHADELQKTPG